MDESIVVSLLGPDDAAVLDDVAPDVFDHPVRPDLVDEFLRDPRHHLVAARALYAAAGGIEGGEPFVLYTFPLEHD